MRKRILILIIALTLAVVTGFAVSDMQEEAVQKAYPGNLIRFHVVANSDSDSDQNLKLKVRDAVLSALQPELAQARSADEAKRNIAARTDELERTAMIAIAQEGFNYGVKATVGDFVFPARAYGNLALPAGSYSALKVVIGEGEGHNWWCVLFPPLCFVNIANGVAVPSESEVFPVLAPDSDEGVSQTMVKVKMIELINSSKAKIVQAFNLSRDTAR